MTEKELEKKLKYMLLTLAHDFATFQGESKVVLMASEISKNSNFKDIEKKGIPAKIVAVNNNYLTDQRDTALLHIEGTNLPAVSFAKETHLLAVGSPVYTTGFPSVAEFNEEEGFVEPIFTRGIVSTLKDSNDGSFKMYKSDAKVSLGSNGGPLLNSEGTVSGIVSLNPNTRESNDPFGGNSPFVVPNSIINMMLFAAKVNTAPGSYGVHFKQGLAFLHDRRCEKALAEFVEAGKVNVKFPVEQYLQPYVIKCKEMIARGDSIDTVWDEYRDRVRGWGVGTWSFVVGAPVAIIVLVVTIIMITHRSRKGESSMKETTDDHNRHP